MDDEEIKEISQVMASLGTVSSNIVERLFIEFAEQVSSIGSLVGSMESTERLLGKVLGGDRVANLEEIRDPAGRTMWDKLANVNEQVLANYLKNEYPQTVAVRLANRSGTCRQGLGYPAGKLRHGSGDAHAAHGGGQQGDRKGCGAVLRTEFMSNLARTNCRDSHEMMAEIFNNLDRATESRFISARGTEQGSAERIRRSCSRSRISCV